MGEYQYYEFQALDRPLNQKEQAYVQSLSSRVVLTGSNAQFVYHYGDLHGRPEEILDRCFDIMLYVASFGVRKVMIRLPKTLVDATHYQPYDSPEGIEITCTGKSVIIDIHLVCENYYSWIEEGEYSLAPLLALREELLQGDLRILYLAWLQAGFYQESEEDWETRIEPPVPPNLQQLSPALEAFVEMFQIDQDVVAAAAVTSPVGQAVAEPWADWIAALPEAERNEYLLRVVEGETHVGAELRQYLRESSGQAGPMIGANSGRSFAEIMVQVEQQRQQRQRQEQQAAARDKQKRLRELAPRQAVLWQEVERLIGLKQGRSYDQAVRHLQDLRDVAALQQASAQFQSRIQRMQQQYSNRPGLLSRLQKAGF